MQIVNLHQSNFIVPQEDYKLFAPSRFQERRKLEKDMDEIVIRNFLQDGFQVESSIEKTSISPSLKPFKRPRWESIFYPTNDPDIFIGFVAYTLDTANHYISKRVFSEFNKNTNSITHWMPNPNIHQFYLGNIYFDVANGVLYQTMGIRESEDPNCKQDWNSNCPYITKTYSSIDDGNTWAEDSTFQNLFDTFQLIKFEFLDKEHALGFTRRKVAHPKGYGMQQGTYYLIRNMRVVDSLQTPDDVHYNDNYSQYSFNRKGDTIYLGPWGYDMYNFRKPFVQPLLLRSDTSWTFEITADSSQAIQNRALKEDKTRSFQNFDLLENRKMVFKNGAGRLTLNSDVGDEASHSGVKIIEKEKQIYIIDDEYTLVSFDGGIHWNLYPKPLNTAGRYYFLKIDSENIISFFDLSKMEKFQYHFFKTSQ